MEFRSKNFTITTNEVLEVLHKKVEDAIKLVDTKGIELYILESTKSDGMFYSLRVEPKNIRTIAEALDEKENFEDGYYIDEIYEYTVEFRMPDLFKLGINEIKEKVEDKLKEYTKSIFYKAENIHTEKS